MKDNPGDTPWFTGTALIGMDDANYSPQIRTYEGPNGQLHSLLTSEYYSHSYPYRTDKSFTIDVNLSTGAVIEGGHALMEADAAATLDVVSPSGSTTKLHSVFNKSTNKVDQVEINGVATDATGVVQWAKDNNLNFKDYTNGSSTIREYWADVKTDYGTKQIIVAAESNGVAFNRQQYESTQNWGRAYEASRDNTLNIHITDNTGTDYNIFSRIQPLSRNKYGDGGTMEYIINGKTMTSKDFINMAESGGNFEKRTFTIDGHSVEEYWGKQDLGGGSTRNIRLAASVDGNPQARFVNTEDYSRSIKDASGNAYDFAQVYYSVDGKGRHMTEINGIAMTDSQLLDWVKTKNFETRNYNVNGHNISEYWDSSADKAAIGDTKQLITTEVDGSPAAMDGWWSYNNPQFHQIRAGDTSLWTDKREVVNQAGDRFRFEEANYGNYSWSGGKGTAGVYVDNNRMDAQQLVNWAKANNFRSNTINVGEHTITEYHSDNQHPYLSNVIAAEIDGKAYNSGDYANSPDGVHISRSVNVINKTGDQFEFDEAAYNIPRSASGSAGAFADGKWMNTQQSLEWAKANNLYSRTVNANGHTITEYYADKPSLNSNIVAAEIDGNAYNNTEYSQNSNGIHSQYYNLSGVTNAGENFLFDEKVYNGAPNSSAGAYIGDQWMNARQLADWSKTNLYSRTANINGHTVTEYYADKSAYYLGGSVVAAEIDGTAYLRTEYRQNQYAMKTADSQITNRAGERFQYSEVFTNDNSAPSRIGAFAGDQWMNAQQNAEWAKKNNFNSRTIAVDGHTITEYYTGSPASNLFGEKVIAAEVDGTAYFKTNQSPIYLQSRGTELVNKEGKIFKIAEVYYHNQKGAGPGNGTAGVIVGDQLMNAQQLLDWTKGNNFYSRTADVNGHTVTEYYDKLRVSNTFGNMHIVSEIDGKAYFQLDQKPINVSTLSSEVINRAGERFKFTALTYYDDKLTGAAAFGTVNAYIGDQAMNAQQLVDWAKNNNLFQRTQDVGVHTVTEYYNSDPAAITYAIAAEIDGKAYFHYEYLQSPIRQRVTSPIALDLTGEGFKTTGVEQGVKFDLTGSGEAVQTGWVAGDTALLALDRNNNGAIDSGKELFGDQYGAANGYDELAKFDDNKDNVINASDAVFSSLRLWRDSNSDGVSGAGELVSLKDAGVSSLSLNYRQTPDTDAFGNKFAQRSTFTRTDGALGQSADIWFKFMSTSAYMKQQFNYNG